MSSLTEHGGSFGGRGIEIWKKRIQKVPIPSSPCPVYKSNYQALGMSALSAVCLKGDIVYQTTSTGNGEIVIYDRQLPFSIANFSEGHAISGIDYGNNGNSSAKVISVFPKSDGAVWFSQVLDHPSFTNFVLVTCSNHSSSRVDLFKLDVNTRTFTLLISDLRAKIANSANLTDSGYVSRFAVQRLNNGQYALAQKGTNSFYVLMILPSTLNSVLFYKQIPGANISRYNLEAYPGTDFFINRGASTDVFRVRDNYDVEVQKNNANYSGQVTSMYYDSSENAWYETFQNVYSVELTKYLWNPVLNTFPTNTSNVAYRKSFSLVTQYALPFFTLDGKFCILKARSAYSGLLDTYCELGFYKFSDLKAWDSAKPSIKPTEVHLLEHVQEPSLLATFQNSIIIKNGFLISNSGNAQSQFYNVLIPISR